MQIHLMRHAIAEDLGSGPWKRDADRPLTKEGIKKTRRAGRGLVAAGIGFDRIVSSPLVRASETAELIAKEQDPAVEVELLEGLAPGVVPEELFQALGLTKRPPDDRILLVGHEPDLGLLAAWLLDLPPGFSLPFSKGAIARFDSDQLPLRPPLRLRWLLSASIAGSLGAD